MSSNIQLVLFYLKKMGCICTKKSIRIEGVNYAIVEHIGDGGFSTISLIEDRRTGKRYALKKITCHSTEDQIQARKEIDFHKRFNHPNILPLIGSDIKGQADIVHNVTSEAFLVLPYFQRGTLADELAKKEKNKDYFQEYHALVMFLQICEGSVESARTKITTHSEAQYLQDLAAERCSMPYRPPELFQVDSKCDIDERTDVWSLGCLLYAIAFWKSPFDIILEKGDSIALAVQSGPSCVKFPPSCPFSKGFQELIMWMLTLDIQKRPFISDIADKLTLLIETSEDKL